MICKYNKKFASYYINYLVRFDFKKKPFRYGFTSIYLFSLQIVIISSLLPTPVLVNVSIILPLTIIFKLLPT